MAETHSINQQKFDIQYYDQRGVHQLQNKLRAISSDSLQRKIQSILDEFNDKDATISLNQIELNLGRIKENELETEIVERVGRQLRAYLSDAIPQLKANPHSERGSIIHNTAKKIDLLAYFLHHGALPWWSNTFGNINLQSLIKELLQGTAKDIVALVRKNGASRTFIQRLVITFDDSTISSLIEKLEPAEAKTILEIGKDTIRLHRKNLELNASQEQFRNKVWEFILIYLLNDRGSYFNTKDFTRSLLYQLAGHFNVSFQKLIAQFYQVIQSLQEQISQTQTLASILKNIYEEESSTAAETNNDSRKQEPSLTTSKLLELLKSGKVKIAELNTPRYKSTFEELLQEQNTAQKNALIHLASPEDIKLLKKMKLSHQSSLKVSHILNLRQAHEARKQLVQQALFEYLQSGSTASKHSGIALEELNLHLQELIRTKARKFKDFILQHGKKNSFRDKLLEALQEPEIKQLVVIIEPTGAPAILGFAEHLQQIKEQGKLSISTNHGDFKKLKWRFILQALLVDRGTRFNLKSFIRSSLSNLAAHLNVSAHLFISQVLSELKSLKESSTTGDLVSVLSELQNEELTSAKRKKARKQRHALKLTRLRWVEYIITRGGLPWWAREQELAITDFQQILLALSETDPKPLKRILHTELVKDRKRRFILKLLDEQGKIGIIKLIQPQALKSILLYTQAIKTLEKQTEASSDKLNIEKWDSIIFALVKDRGSVFNLKSFIMQTLHQMAHHFNLNFAELFTSFLHISQVSLTKQSSDFRQVIMELESDFQIQSQNSAVATYAFDQIDSENREATNWLKEELNRFISVQKLSTATKTALLNWAIQYQHLPYAAIIKVFEQSGISKKQVGLFYDQFSKNEQKRLQPVFKSSQSIQFELNKTTQKASSSANKSLSINLEKAVQNLQVIFQNQESSTSWNNSLLTQLSGWFQQFGTLSDKEFALVLKQAGLSHDQLTSLLTQLTQSEVRHKASFKTLIQTYLNQEATPPSATYKPKSLSAFAMLINNLKSNRNWVFAQTKALLNWLKDNPSESSDELLQLLRASGISEQELQFIFRQFTKSEQSFLLKRLSHHKTLFLEAYHTDIIEILKTTPGFYTARLQNLLAAHGLAYAINQILPDKHAYLQQVLRMISSAWHIKHSELITLFSASINEKRGQLESTIPLSFQKMKAPATKEIAKSSAPMPLPEEPEKEPTNETMIPEELTEIEEEGVFIENAGIVILWPFLNTYFERLGLLQGQQFKDKKSSITAVYALQYLTTGHEDSKEYELYLNKVLCGIKPGTPLATVALAQEQKELSESLLTGVIGNWANMQGTSTEALRETFLERTGHLTPGEEYWSLKVERKTVDVLMETMPWSCSVVQLPWMEKVIHVTW